MKFVFLCHWKCCEPYFLIVNGLLSDILESHKSLRAMSSGMIKNAMCRETILSLVKACSFHYGVKKQNI